ncbi:hypothetical protein K458DRAFT_367899 [Lentithecium fluviatile CBS 122367]|uniref:Transcription factor domain-containing protein n=1 Tax=Lentithecium fluviatile CBS 122367 TaxID=1168545 RepID=A0A6G1IZE2_9PLEO|nr:hypothetical protein K458DRAFT_367899 [Lentithecium fluviatile CBS 122367]
MVKFTFVTHKGARPEQSGLVKAHVMRESQRKRREARQQRHNHRRPDTLPRGDDLTHRSAHLQAPLSSRQLSDNTVSKSRYGGIPDDSESTEIFDPSRTTALENGTELTWGGTQKSTTVHEPHRKCPSLDDAGHSFSNLPYTFTQPPHLLYPTLQGESDLLDPCWITQDLFKRVKELVSHYTSSLYIERPGLPAANPLHYWQDQALVNPKVLLSTSLFYCAYRDAMRGLVSHDRDHEYFKDRSLYLINRALRNSETIVSDDTIAAVISMCMYENVRGSNLVPTHLHGIRHMLDMRGGINNFPSGQGQFICEMAILQDMMHASCSNMLPTMFDITGPILRDVRLNNIENWYPQSPLRVLNDAEFVRPITELQSSFNVLKDAFDAFEMMCIEAFDADTAAEETQPFRLRREQFWARLRIGNGDSSHEIPSTTEVKVEKAVLLTARIHLRAVTMRVQHEDDLNADDMKRLFAIIREIDLKFWKVAHYVYLWILLTGGAAARIHPHHRSHFVSEILRLGLSIGLFDWRSFRQILGNFLWLQQFLRRKGSERSPVFFHESAHVN